MAHRHVFLVVAAINDKLHSWVSYTAVRRVIFGTKVPLLKAQMIHATVA
jgi:hypothetical protein